jgi:hypothetical protein
MGANLNAQTCAACGHALGTNEPNPCRACTSTGRLTVINFDLDRHCSVCGRSSCAGPSMHCDPEPYQPERYRDKYQ